MITKLHCLRRLFVEDTARTLLHTIRVLYSYITSPLPFHSCCYCVVHFTCTITGLPRVFTSRRQFPYSRESPSFCLEKKKKEEEMDLRKANLYKKDAVLAGKEHPEKHFFFSSSRVSDILLLVFSVTIKRVWLILHLEGSHNPAAFFPSWVWIVAVWRALRFLFKANLINYLCLHQLGI